MKSNEKVLAPLVIIVASILLSGVFGVGYGPCHDSLSFQGPEAEFTVTANDSSGLTIQYRSGDTLAETWTDALYLDVIDNASDTTTRYVLVNSSHNFPVKPGDQFSVSIVTGGDERLIEDDSVRIVWKGTQRPFPNYCLNERDNTTLETTLYWSTVTQ